MNNVPLVNDPLCPTPAVWAIVDLMGHKRMAGRLTEEEHFGAKLGRLDVPEGGGFTTHFFGGASVYNVSIVTEAVARAVSRTTSPAPVSPWDFPKQLPPPEESRVLPCGHTIEDCDCDSDEDEDESG